MIIVFFNWTLFDQLRSEGMDQKNSEECARIKLSRTDKSVLKDSNQFRNFLPSDFAKNHFDSEEFTDPQQIPIFQAFPF